MKVCVKNSKDGLLVAEKELSAANNVLTLGRSNDCDIVLQSNSVSRKHARIMYINERIFIEDLGSFAGTLVDKSKISEMVQVDSSSHIELTSFQVLIVCEKSQNTNSLRDESVAEKQKKSEVNKKIVDNADGVNNFLDEFKNASVLYQQETMLLTHKIHEEILDKLNFSNSKIIDISDVKVMTELESTLDQVLKEHRHELPINIPFDLFRQALKDELIGFGPITPMLRSPRISEIMINGPNCIFVESQGKLFDSGVRFYSEQHLLSIIR